ncbi:hypothetical protein [Streptomyces sp. NPDC101181]
MTCRVKVSARRWAAYLNDVQALDDALDSVAADGLAEAAAPAIVST